MQKTQGQKIRDFLINNGVIIVMIVLVIYTGFTSKNFFTVNNFLNLFANMSYRLVIALGSQKHFKFRFQPPDKENFSYQALRRHIIEITKSAYKVFGIWAAIVAVISMLRVFNVLNDGALFMITIVFYVCDLVCVLVWCPFRLIVKAKCCTTCRIFNWDHLMMFSPMLTVSGFFSRTLLLMAIADWLIWELCIMMYPERFWENTNAALRCANCTDKLCTQYCKNRQS